MFTFIFMGFEVFLLFIGFFCFLRVILSMRKDGSSTLEVLVQ